MPKLSLQYPNGRSHEVDWVDKAPLSSGNEFELYGRRWRVVGHEPRRPGGRPDESMPLVCQPITAGLLTNRG